MRSPYDFAKQILAGEAEWHHVPKHLWDETHEHFGRLSAGELKKSEELAKDVGRVTFPKIDPKLTRPDQEVKQVNTPAAVNTSAAVVGNSVEKYHPGRGEGIKDQLHERLSRFFREPLDGTVAGINDQNKKTVDSFAHSNSGHPSVIEHEGFHHLVNKISQGHNIPTKTIYNKMNSFIHPMVSKAILAEHNSTGRPEHDSRQEQFNNVRDIVTNPERRADFLKFVPIEQHRAFMTAAKTSFRNARDWARRATTSDLQKAEEFKRVRQIIDLNDYDSQPLQKAERNLSTGNLEPQSSDPNGMPHPENSSYIKGNSVKTGKKPAWVYRKDIADSIDKLSIDKLKEFKSKYPQHAKTIDKMFHSIAKDGDRHLVESGPERDARARHFAWALQGKQGYSLEPTDNGFLLSAERHPNYRAPTKHTWLFNGEKFKFQNESPISNSSGGNSDGKQKSSFVVNPLKESEGSNLPDTSQVSRGLPRNSLGLHGSILSKAEDVWVGPSDRPSCRSLESLKKSFVNKMVEILSKDIGRIAPKALVGKWARPDQEVKQIEIPEVGPIQKKPSVAQHKYNKALDYKDGESEVISKQKPGTAVYGDKDFRPFAVAESGNKPTIEHEGHHLLVSKLVNNYGVDKMHKMYTKLSFLMHPSVRSVIHELVNEIPQYSKLEFRHEKRDRLAFLEEKVNMLRDLVHQGKGNDGRRSDLVNKLSDRSFLKRHNISNPIDFDSQLKQSWKTIRDKANGMKPEDL